MRDDEPLGQRTQVDEHEDDEFTSAPLDPPRGVPPHISALASALALRGARRRALTLTVTALLLAVVVVGLFVHVASDPRGAVGALLRLSTPTPAATFVPGANVVYFSNGAPWGTLTVDGKRLPQADLTGYGISVTRGVHQLVYQARYFPSVRCVFSAPQAPRDTCRLDTSFDANQFLLGKAPLARMIDLGSTNATMDPAQTAALIQLANEQLQAQALTTTIAPGDRYLDDSGHIAVASAPLQFHMAFALGDATSPAHSNCMQLCFEPTSSNGPSLPGGDWMTQMNVVESSAIFDASGRRLTSASYSASYPAGQTYPLIIPTEVGIELTPTGWRLSWLDALSNDAVETVAMSAASMAVNNAGKNSYGMSFSLAPNPLDGCVMDVNYGNGNTTARLFWRFGMLLAADEAARNVLPALPVANAREQAEVTSILTRPSAT